MIRSHYLFYINLRTGRYVLLYSMHKIVLNIKPYGLQEKNAVYFYFLFYIYIYVCTIAYMPTPILQIPQKYMNEQWCVFLLKGHEMKFSICYL